ncbi:hypothetical protein NDU88_002658 [Pleurodeles waltl]|uniref:Uncharacterized protein n=1 Tax=Pleurodeles waltl TaxID=8319 RepID=A0AAV7W313_PLEWA|nr:hypothetical protein NDU88_002658 [Pleurodeles waltl]
MASCNRSASGAALRLEFGIKNIFVQGLAAMNGILAHTSNLDTVTVDASQIGLGAVLSQILEVENLHFSINSPSIVWLGNYLLVLNGIHVDV